MKEANQDSTSSAYLTPHLWALGRDPWILAAAGLLAGQWFLTTFASAILPIWLITKGPMVLLGGLTFGALWRNLEVLRQREERLFWKDLAAASGAWLGVYILQMGSALPFLNVIADLFYIAFFVIFVLALERRPHRHHPWRPGTLDRSLSWPALLVFVGCLLSYLVIQPIYFEAYLPQIASTWLVLVLDVFLTIRLVLVASKSSSVRWQNLYTVLAIAMMLAVSRDLWQVVAQSETLHPLKASGLILAACPPLLLVVAARLRLRRFPADALIEEERADAGISSPAGQGLVFALALPLLHFSFQAFVDDTVPAKHRELLLLCGSLALAGLAYLQYQRLRGGMKRLRSERSLFEEELLESEQDLRLMVEQKQTAETLSTFERNFVEIFHRNPDAIAVCSLTDGDFLEVNDAFATLFGYTGQEMTGQTPYYLGLLSPDEDLEPLKTRLHRQDSLRIKDFACRDHQGKSLELDVSAQRVEIDGQPCALIVASLPDEIEDDTPSTPDVEDWFANATDSVWVADSEGTITYWNRAAEALLGWPVERVLGQPIDSVLEVREHDQILTEVDAQGQWSGEFEAVHADGQSVRLCCRYLLLNEAKADRPEAAEEPVPSSALPSLRLAICRDAGDGGATEPQR